MMPTYEQLIYEFVERGRGQIGAGLSPEIKIILLTVIGSVLFLVIKYISRWLGSAVGGILQNIVNNLLIGGPTQGDMAHVHQHINHNAPRVSESNNGSAQQPPIPEVPNFMGGLNIASMLSSFGRMFGGGGSAGSTANPSGSQTRPRAARRRPVFTS